MLKEVLAALVRQGQVAVEVPGLDMERLEAILRSRCMQTLRRVKMVIHSEDISDAEKIEILCRYLEGW